MDERKPVDLNMVIHERARLMILTYLTGNERDMASFAEIKDALTMTSGNLSVQLRNLEQAGYVTIDKRFEDKRPVTEVRLSHVGARALAEYLNEMERIIQAARGNAGK